MNDLLFAHQKKIKLPDLLEYARQLNLDLPLFQRRLRSGYYKGIIDRDWDLATSLGVDSTPTFFVNGNKLVGEQTPEQLQSAIEGKPIPGAPDVNQLRANKLGPMPLEPFDDDDVAARGPVQQLPDEIRRRRGLHLQQAIKFASRNRSANQRRVQQAFRMPQIEKGLSIPRRPRRRKPRYKILNLCVRHRSSPCCVMETLAAAPELVWRLADLTF